MAAKRMFYFATTAMLCARLLFAADLQVEIPEVETLRHVQVRIDVTDVPGYPPVYNESCATPHVTSDTALMLDVSMDVFVANAEIDTDFRPPDQNALVNVDTNNDHCGMSYTDVWTGLLHLNDPSARVSCEHARNYPYGSRDGVTSPITIDVFRDKLLPVFYLNVLFYYVCTKENFSQSLISLLVHFHCYSDSKEVSKVVSHFFPHRLECSAFCQHVLY
uniref:ZP domain-containing protein n=1 Tax=Branchiostoma floridae TaxID=7739 RepID=C3XWX2_BRAFL|eukprot:XP_002611222.1 hypothetical protein BRAFLDRAFT_71182 [Branchiostoma floridae]